MTIQSIFKNDINRKINGVVMVNQKENAVLVQELNEYVVTRELKKHFKTFFRNYVESFNEYTADIGVWISGFFGSGKSHFLKMLSYLLTNEEIDGVKTVERFREKFADAPEIFTLIERVTKCKADTILFNIDAVGPKNKNKTAVLRIFAKMFYKYLGFYGEDFKLVKLEQFVDSQGKTAEFRRVFEVKHGAPWLESRNRYTFLKDVIVATMHEVLGMSEQSARDWFKSKETDDLSIDTLVGEIKEYVSRQPQDFRLLFMADEVGQYVGGDTSLLLNLQTLVEEIGNKCGGKVWVICTGQEAIDDVIKARENEFSRIQGRFKTRLSLSSSAADEVIQKRILLKTDAAAQNLAQVYANNESVLSNLFTLTNVAIDIKGYAGADEFVKNFPFVPYQFVLMQKVFVEIRRHGNIGTHLSGGERSMLSGFQEAAQKIEDKDEYALAPFYLFYDTVHTFLDSSIRRVIERCARAAEEGNKIEPQDLDVLKLLYLVRYVSDIQATLDNIVILMADDIRLDKIIMRAQVQSSLDRLLTTTFIGHSQGIYKFLTDEEQDIQREIKNTLVAQAEIVAHISKIIFGDIYTTRKFHLGKYDFPFDRMVDGQADGTLVNDMMLRFLTLAANPAEESELWLMTESVDRVIVVLNGADYYDYLERAMQIRKYAMQLNRTQQPHSVQNIIRERQDEAGKLEQNATDALRKAIVNAKFYVGGKQIVIQSGDAKTKLDEALKQLVASVYRELALIDKFADSDDDIFKILRGTTQTLQGTAPNKAAADKVESYLDMQFNLNKPTTMADVQERFRKKPYGWREIDIAAVVAMLIRQQKVTVKYAGMTIQPDNPKLPDMLRKKSEIGKTSISKRQAIAAQKIRAVRDFLLNFFDGISVPHDEDGLVKHIEKKFEDELNRYAALNARYANRNYPDQAKVNQAVALAKDILSQRKDNTALIQRVIDKQNELYDMRDDLSKVEVFFKNQVALFDRAVDCQRELYDDRDYIARHAAANQALNQIRAITTIPAAGNFNYKRIPELNTLLAKLIAAHDELLADKRAELLEIVRQCLEEIHTLANASPTVKNISNAADEFFAQKREQIAACQKLALLDGLIPQIWQRKDETVSKMEAFLRPPIEPPPSTTQEFIKAVHRQAIFPAKILRSEAEIDSYVEKIRADMKRLLKTCNGIKLN